MTLSRAHQHQSEFFAALLLLAALLSQQFAYGLGTHEQRAALPFVTQNSVLRQNPDALCGDSYEFRGSVGIQGVGHTVRDFSAGTRALFGDGTAIFGRHAHSSLCADLGVGTVASARLLLACQKFVPANAHGSATFTEAAEVGFAPSVGTEGILYLQASKLSIDEFRHNGAAPQGRERKMYGQCRLQGYPNSSDGAIGIPLIPVLAVLREGINK